MKVLILIGSQLLKRVIMRHLSFLSTEATFVSTVTEAKIVFEGGEFALFCFERYLSDGSGLDLCKQLRTHPAGAKAPILLLTTSEDPKLAQLSADAGVTKVFSKYEVDQLGDYVAKFEEEFHSSSIVRGSALIVEDSMSVAHVIQTVLKDMGLNHTTVTKAEDAWALLNKRTFDIVISDLQLEGNMTGLGLLLAIRQAEAPLSRIPVLAISGTADDARKIELLRSGANDYISKPLLAEEMEVRVRNMVHHKQLFDEAEAQRDHLRRLAMTDQLTGLYNRHYMAEVASTRIGEALKHGIPVSLILLDLDHFKKINDTHGHDVGDVVLAETAKVLSSVCLKTDTASRAGGEEFVMMLINRDAKNALGFAEFLRSQIEALEPAGIRVTASIGVASVKRGGQADFKTLFKAADEATYEAKSGGRNQVVAKEVDSISEPPRELPEAGESKERRANRTR